MSNSSRFCRLVLVAVVAGCGGSSFPPASGGASGATGGAGAAGVGAAGDSTDSGGAPGGARTSGNAGSPGTAGQPSGGAGDAGSGGTAGSNDAGMGEAGHAGAGSGGTMGAAGGGTAGMMGAAGAIGAGGTGSSSIDFSIWELQLPTGKGTSPATISPAQLVAGYSDAYFYRAGGGGQMFMDPATGITTSGSLHCRTELREMMSNGQAAGWPSTGTNTMTVSGKILQVGGGASGHVTVAQVFNGTNSIPLCELEYSTKLGGFQLLYEEAKGAGTTTNLKAPVAVGTAYTFTLDFSNGVLSVGVDGKIVYTKTPGAATAAKNFYFKAGDYDQTATAGPISTTPYTIVEVDTLDVVHH
jgi:hypothetical protein